MKEKTLLLFCLAGAFLGIMGLYVISVNLSFLHVNLNDVDEGKIGDIVNVSGTTMNVRKVEGNMFFDLSDDTGKIKVVIWNDTLEFLEGENFDTGLLSDGARVGMLASVELYRGEIELIPLREYIFLYT